MVVAADCDEHRRREIEHFSRHAKTNASRSSGGKMNWRERPHREHFGFRDGTSQPGIRGLTAPSDPNKPDQGEPGQHLITPVLGYLLQGPPKAAVTAPYPPTPAAGSRIRNGSSLVFRRLRQDAKGFGISSPRRRQSKSNPWIFSPPSSWAWIYGFPAELSIKIMSAAAVSVCSI